MIEFQVFHMDIGIYLAIWGEAKDFGFVTKLMLFITSDQLGKEYTEL